MNPVQRTFKRVGRWYTHAWDGISGKDHRRLKQLRQTLTELQHQEDVLKQRLSASQHNEASLKQQLDHAIDQAEIVRTKETHTVQQLKERLREAEQKENQLRQQLTEVKQHCTQLQQILDETVKARQQALAASTQQLTDTKAELEAMLTYSDSEIQNLESRLANQQDEIGRCHVQLGKALATPPSELSDIPISSISLSSWKIALVGGHTNTTRGVRQQLRDDYGLRNLVEIPPIPMPQHQLKQKLENCDLIVLIVWYNKHTLTQSVGQLKKKGSLPGELLPINCRGATGVVREILTFIENHQNNHASQDTLAS